MHRPLSRMVAMILASLLICLLVLPQHSRAIARSEAQHVVQKPIDQQTLFSAQAKTQKIWNDLRESEPTRKESIIDAKPVGLTGMLWHYSKIVVKTLFMNAPSQSTDSQTRLSSKLQAAVDGLEKVSSHDPDALFLLAEMNFYGNFSHPRRPGIALQKYHALAETGNATAQHMLGVLYSTGIAGEVDQAMAQMYYTFAAEQGQVRSEMTMAFRHHQGIGTVKSCEKSVEYYKRVADKSMDWWLSGPPGGHHIQRNAYRWVDEAGGVYGEGASWSSSGPYAVDKNVVYSSFDNILEYLDMQERQGNIGASLQLGKHFYEPPRGYRRNLKKARSQFLKVATQYWTRDGKVNPKAPKNIEKHAAKAAAYLGRMFLRGEGTEQNFEKAATWFKRGISSGDSFAQYHMGLMFRDGHGMPKDGYRAAAYLKAASEQSLGIAMTALGTLFLDQDDLDSASRYFELAKNAGVMEAYYYLAEFANHGIGRQQNCHHAATYYKIVAEKAEAFHSSFVEANSAHAKGDHERAFIASLLAAEQGFESAQANVAFLLDKKTSVLSVPILPIFSNPLESVPVSKRTNLLDNDVLALACYTRSAHQQLTNVDSLIKAGDYHFLGIGTPTKTMPIKSNKTTAGTEAMYSCYSAAAEYPNAAQALWNMGWMHENGVGMVEQDFHMAKRYYDLALEMNKESYLPVKLALIKLRARSWWNGISGGSVKSIDDEEEPKKSSPKSLKEWLGRFIDAAVEDAMATDQGELDDLEHIAYGEPGMPGGDNEYWYSGKEGDDFLDDFDDGLMESLIIVALAGALALLVYVRAQRQRDQRERQGQAQAQQPQPPVQPQDRGFMPEPGNPDYFNWVAGGIGH